VSIQLPASCLAVDVGNRASGSCPFAEPLPTRWERAWVTLPGAHLRSDRKRALP